MKKKLEKCIIHKKVQQINLFMFCGICYTMLGLIMLVIGVVITSIDWFAMFIVSMAGMLLMSIDKFELYRTEEVEQEAMIERR